MWMIWPRSWKGYYADEFESRLEDDSADWVAGRLVQLHKVIYATFPPTSESLANATAEIDKLEQAAVALRGRKVTAQRTNESDDDITGSEEEGEDEDGDAMDVDEATAPSVSTKKGRANYRRRWLHDSSQGQAEVNDKTRIMQCINSKD